MSGRPRTEAEAMAGAVLSPVDDHAVAQLRIPPHSIEAESSVLGGLLLDNGAWDRVGDLLTDSDFYRYEHRLIYAAIAQLSNASRQADVVTVHDYLQNEGKAAEVGGLSYINALAQYVPSAGNIRRYAQIVRERSILRTLIATTDSIATNAFNPQGRSVDAIVDDAMQRIIAISPDVSEDEWVPMARIITQQLDDVQLQCDTPEGARDQNYIPTGFWDLDEMIDGGLRGSQFILIAARPSMGKSALAYNIGLHVAMNHGLPVGVFNLEMENQEGGQRAMASVGNVPLHVLRQPKRMDDMHWRNLTTGVEKLRHVPFYSNDASGLNINQIRAKARALKRKHGLSLLVLDYFQLIAGIDPRQNRNAQLEEASRGLKSLAKELGIPIIALAQVNRSVEKEGEAWTKQMPRMADLKDCGSLEQDADIILFLLRPIVAQPGLDKAEWGEYAKGHLAKQRGGRTGFLHFRYEGQHTRFSTWPTDTPIPTSKAITSHGGGL